MYFTLDKLSVGYAGKALIRDIDISVERGKIVTLVGPNGSGKSTILKTITRQLEKIAGVIVLGERELSAFGSKELAKRLSVMLTERIEPELMTCGQVAAMGRYPYTGYFGRLTPEDERIVEESLRTVNALELAEVPFSDVSDGQRQRILLARALCQEPEILVLDEPTSYLDIRHKIELLDVLRRMAREKNMAVVMSLHEIDLAVKVSDQIICVKGDRIGLLGPPEEIFTEENVTALYDLKKGAFNTLFGSVELAAPAGSSRVFVLAGGGMGIPVYRKLQREKIPFSTGILFENDVDWQVAKVLAAQAVTAPAFSGITPEQVEEAKRLIGEAEYVIDAGTAVGEQNRCFRALKDYAVSLGKTLEKAETAKGEMA